MDDVLVVKGVASSFVINDMKINTDTGSGEAKLFIGSIKNSEKYDAFFEYDNGYKYKMYKENLKEYLNQVKLEYAFQKFNKYKNVSIERWKKNYDKIDTLEDVEIVIDLKKYTDDNGRYYIKSSKEIFKKILREITIPKLTNVVFEKDTKNKVISIKLQLNLEFDADERKESWIISANPEVYNHKLCFLDNGYIEWGQKINCKINDIIYIYVTKPSGRIKYKTRVIEKDIDYKDLEISKDYWINGNTDDEKAKYMRLALEDSIDSDELSLENLRIHGLASDLQSPQKLSNKPELLKYIESVFNKEIIELKEYTEDELAEILKEFYNNPKFSKMTGIHLFGIKYGQLIKMKNYNRTQIIRKAGLDDCLKTELIEAVSLSDFVEIKEKDTEYRINSNTQETKPVNYHTGYTSEFSRNRIIFGAPGTGKSFKLKEDAAILLKGGNEENYERVTFHPDYSYANFVGTYKPVPCKNNDDSNGITYEYVPGPFMRIYVEAIKNSRTDNIKPYLLIVEEINRANVAAVFGDVFQLLDRTEENISEYPIEASEDIRKYLASNLGGDQNNYKKIYIPDNMFIWATMNSADQGVFPIDTAFKRRWDFDYLGIDEKEEDISGRYVILGEGEDKRKVEWNKLRKLINNELRELKINEDKLLGPYFIAKKVIEVDKKGEIDKDVFIPMFKGKVLMYLIEDAAKQRKNSLFDDKYSHITYSLICEEFNKKGVNVFNNNISKEFDKDIPEEDD